MDGACSTYRGEESLYMVLVGKPEGKNHLQDADIDRGIILRWILRKWNVGAWTGSIWFRIGTGKAGNFLTG